MKNDFAYVVGELSNSVVVVALRVTTAPADVRSAFLCETAPAAIIEAGRCLPAKQWFWEAVIAHFP